MSTPRYIFEPHNLFRSSFLGEDWPIGYISEGIGNPILALHDVLGDQSAKACLVFAEKIVAALNEACDDHAARPTEGQKP